MSSFAKISIRILADLKQFSSQMQNAQRDMQKMGQNLTKVGQGLTLGITLPVLGLGVAAVSAASDAEETASKFKVVFRDVAKDAQASADLLRNSYGLSSQASNQLLSDTGDLLTGFGFSQKSALDLSTEVNKLAVDLASFTNFSGGAEGASQALTKALLGERESVKSLGISILESDVKARVLINAQQGLTFETERQAKAFATLQIAQEQSKNAIGDYARTSDGFANQMRLLKARLNDVAVQFGEILLPYVSKLAGFVGTLIEKFSNLSSSTKKIILVVAGLAAAIGPVLMAAGVLMTTVIPGLITAFGAVTLPILGVVAALTAVAFVVYKYWGPIKKQMVALANYFIDLYNESTAFRIAVEYIIFVFKSIGAYAKFLFNGLITGFKGIANYIIDMFSNVGAGVKAILTGDFAALPGIVKNFGAIAASNLSKTWDNLGKDVAVFAGDVKENFNAAIDAVTNKKKIAFLEENVDASAISSAVASAVNEGLSGGGGDGAPAKRNEIALPGLTTNGNEALNPFSALQMQASLMPEITAAMSAEEMKMLDNALEFNEGLSNIMGDAAANFATGFAQMIGSAAQGGLSIKNIGKFILTTIADMAMQVGQMAIGIGIAVIGIKKALQSLSGPVAIAAGVALIALASFAKSALSNVAEGGGNKRTAFANGGIVYGPTNALIGEYSGARNNPEVVAPLDKLKSLLGGGSGGKMDITVKGILKGTDMHLQAVRTEQYLNRRS